MLNLQDRTVYFLIVELFTIGVGLKFNETGESHLKDLSRKI